MPRLKGHGKGPSDRINIRLDGPVGAFYRSKANEHGLRVSDYLRGLLTQGVITENVQEIEQRLRALIGEIAAAGDRAGGGAIPDALLLSVLTSEALLSKIVEQRDTQELYAAQEVAKARLLRIKGG